MVMQSTNTWQSRGRIKICSKFGFGRMIKLYAWK
jgi:hypothetical protein